MTPPGLGWDSGVCEPRPRLCPGEHGVVGEWCSPDGKLTPMSEKPAARPQADPTSSDPVARLVAAARNDPAAVLVASDFDGVLAPIVDDPDQAYADPESVAALGALGGLIGQVAIITGRPVAAARRLGRLDGAPGLGSLLILGQYGVERWDAASGELVMPPEPAEIAQARVEIAALLSRLDLTEVWVEDKGRALGLHTRRTADPEGAFERLREPVTELTERLGLHLEPGRMVWELRAAGQDKGRAIAELIEATGARMVVYAGDDLGDIPAFRTVAELREQGRIEALLLWSRSEEQAALADICDVACDGVLGVAQVWRHIADELETHSH
ncbi:trehalose-phosphatase [Parenemella sanctibonifatiensis]|uniref:Trehalose 6-phosphate phosphatase n=2 Tax=Parenemella sanctibonifatiensis TaxID=2016505 RepID=A0A255EB13_9ACTN|nr:trehalose-phosphatase [Parenemella sanctibonifatiensis]